MTTFIGIDPSLTNTGVAVYDDETGVVRVSSFGSKATPDSSLDQRAIRVSDLVYRVISFIGFNKGPAYVAIEGPAFSSNNGKTWDRADLWWLLVRNLMDRAIEVIEIPPTSRAKYATGSGRAGKDEVILAVARNYPEIEFKNNDEADAVTLCAMLARLHESPMEQTITKDRLDALKKLQEGK